MMNIRRFFQSLAFFSIAFLLAGVLGVHFFNTATAADANRRPLTIILDSGHNPSQQGALGARGVYEVAYNDNLTTQVANALKGAGFSVILTRTPTQEISLGDRVQVANASHADLFLAIHHDSAQLKYLEKTTWNSLPAYRTTESLAGYSLFVSTLNPRFDDSSRFAELLGQEMFKLGRGPSHHHGEKIPGENRELLNAKLGIYRFDDLIVLKKTSIPAVLLEIGVIVDQEDEKYVSSKENQKAIVRAIVTAVQEYDRSRVAR